MEKLKKFMYHIKLGYGIYHADNELICVRFVGKRSQGRRGRRRHSLAGGFKYNISRHITRCVV